MSDLHFRKSGRYTLEAITDEAQAFLSKTKFGGDVLITAKRPRNYEYHKRIFALVSFAFENVDLPEGDYKGGKIIPNLEGFRRDLMVKSGFYDVSVNSFTGDLRLIPHSLSYSKCNQEKAEKVYSAMLDCISKELYNSDIPPDELEKLSEEYMRFI